MPGQDFNIAGPCVSGKHYMLDPMRGIGDELMDLIDRGYYFVIHAARQTGKTTLLWELANEINDKGDYYALYCSLETADGLADPEKGIPAIIDNIRYCIKSLGLPEGFAGNVDYGQISVVLKSSLMEYCRSLDKPLVLLFDEVDCLRNGTLITFLRQLRDGYISRGRIPFVHSVALVGMRNLRDYKAQTRPDSETLEGASPFNIVAKYFNLRNFTRAEVADLYGQHTVGTGQVFESDAVDFVFERTQGQPWLVNAIAREAVEEITRNDHSIPIIKDLADQAIQNLIQKWGTHFDSMMAKLREPRVRNIIEQLLLGEGDTINVRSNDYLFTRDLGLVREVGSIVEPANPIYAELIVRTLNWSVQQSIMRRHKNYEIPRYMKDGRIDMDFLIMDFQQYWRENSEIWKDSYKTDFYEYDAAAPHLVLQAFLQRVINSGGHIIREMALGTKRADLCVVYSGHKYPIELKILQTQRNYAESLGQIQEYMDKMGSDTGWLVIFDRDTKKGWDDKIYIKKEFVNGKEITVAGC